MALTAQEEITAAGVAAQAADSIATDSVSPAQGMQLLRGITIERPAVAAERPLGETGTGMSWLLTGLFLVFVVVCLRYKKNSRYFSLLLNDITEMRERHNAFDDTLRETSFVWLLNLLWCGAAGVILYGLTCGGSGGFFSDLDPARLGLCVAIAAAYTLFLALAYVLVGNLFSDGHKASLWIKGFLSTQGMESMALFPTALLALCVPGLFSVMIVVGVIIFLVAKILFIYKSFCIFFADYTTWVLFLYYLCSLELVPIVLAYVAAMQIG